MTTKRKPTTTLPAASPAPKLPSRSRPPEISKKLQTALDSMVERGCELQKAAEEGGMTTRGLRLALQRPAVLRYLRRARADLILSIRATTPRRMRQLRDQNSNMAAAVAAGRLLEDMGDEVIRGEPGTRTPGFQIVIVQPAASDEQPKPTQTPQIKIVEHEPPADDTEGEDD
jgi:hypothetical protein